MTNKYRSKQEMKTIHLILLDNSLDSSNSGLTYQTLKLTSPQGPLLKIHINIEAQLSVQMKKYQFLT